MTVNKSTTDCVHMVAGEGCVITDTRNGNEYSEVICEAKDTMFFVDAINELTKA